jgi:hypothetical protein
MHVLFGLRDTFEKEETMVYFIGVFDTIPLAQQKINELMVATEKKRTDYILKTVSVNQVYDYHWNHSEEDEIL